MTENKKYSSFVERAKRSGNNEKSVVTSIINKKKAEQTKTKLSLEEIKERKTAVTNKKEKSTIVSKGK